MALTATEKTTLYCFAKGNVHQDRCKTILASLVIHGQAHLGEQLTWEKFLKLILNFNKAAAFVKP